MTNRLTGKYQRAAAAQGLGRCKHTTCDRDVPSWNRYAAGRKPSKEEMQFCSIRCAIRYERLRRRRMREHVARSAAALLRFCHVCDTRIPADRLRRHHNARSCSDPCSLELRVQTNARRARVTSAAFHAAELLTAPPPWWTWPTAPPAAVRSQPSAASSGHTSAPAARSAPATTRNTLSNLPSEGSENDRPPLSR